MWVGKLAYLTTNPVTVQEGRRAIAQAISDNRVEGKGIWTSLGKPARPNSLLSLIPQGPPHLDTCVHTLWF